MKPLSAFDAVDHANAACIIGSGPGGLSTARALKGQGIEYDHYERHSDVGGIWDLNNPGTPMYQSAHFISSRDLSGFIGYPMPATFPDYPSHVQITDYLRAFAHDFGLYENIRFNTSVERIYKDEQSHWVVVLADGSAHRYRWVVLATGTNWKSSTPTFAGQFDGEIRHSNTFKYDKEFNGKTVLVVGAGNSGADISCEAAVHASKAFLSVRRGYHFIPKHVFGVPADVFSEKGPHLPLWLARPIFKQLLRVLVGDLTRWGLPAPDHALFETHPIVNSQLIHHLQHGNITVKPDIEKLDGHEVVFKGGSRERVDLIICATGYQWGAACANEYFEWKNGRPLLYLSMFSRTHRNLCAIGYLDHNSSAFKLFDTQAFTLAAYFKAQLTGSASAGQFDELIRHDDPDLSGGIDFVKSDRHAVYMDARAFAEYLKKLRATLHWGDVTASTYRPLSSSALPRQRQSSPVIQEATASGQ